MSDKPNRNLLAFHKPGCRCNACKGKAKAVALTAGAGGSPVASTSVLQESSAQTTTALQERPLDADGFETIHTDDPKGTTRSRERLLKWIAYRGQGLKNAEIAPLLGVSEHTLEMTIYRANKAGWLKYNDPLERFHNEIVPKVVDNIDYFVDRKDKTMTIEAAKGAGIFRSHQAVKVEGDAPNTVLALKIETVDASEKKVLTGHVVGRARQLEEAHES